ncbi:hypothetical protein C8R44DRAFT_732282 [Mycena epipterygia]|nr:hypothetical protein C8R44DRAFT_732282 [Mycena epipterygia]
MPKKIKDEKSHRRNVPTVKWYEGHVRGEHSLENGEYHEPNSVNAKIRDCAGGIRHKQLESKRGKYIGSIEICTVAPTTSASRTAHMPQSGESFGKYRKNDQRKKKKKSPMEPRGEGAIFHPRLERNGQTAGKWSACIIKRQ